MEKPRRFCEKEKIEWNTKFDWKFQRHVTFLSWILHVSPTLTVWIEVKFCGGDTENTREFRYISNDIDVTKSYMVVITKSISYRQKWVSIFLCNVITLQQFQFSRVWHPYARNDGTNQMRMPNNRKESKIKRNIYLPPSLNMVRVRYLDIFFFSFFRLFFSFPMISLFVKVNGFPINQRQTNIISYPFWLFRSSQWVFFSLSLFIHAFGTSTSY